MNLQPDLNDFVEVQAIGFTNAFKFIGKHNTRHFSDFTAYSQKGAGNIFALRSYDGTRYVHKGLAKQLLQKWGEENEGQDEG